MTIDQLLTVLLGGIGGALAAQLIQIVRDSLSARRRLRSAARVVRTELVRNLSIMTTVRELGRVPADDRHEISSHRFERSIDALASEISRDEMALLIAAYESNVTASHIHRQAKERLITPNEAAWIDRWSERTAICHVLMDIRGERWWTVATRWREVRRVRAAAKQAVQE